MRNDSYFYLLSLILLNNTSRCLGTVIKMYFKFSICFPILGIEWKKVYSLTHPASLGKNGFFMDHKDAKTKNPNNETAELFSILGELEQYRSCSGDFHFKICYPELSENFSFPCNEWTQSNNPSNNYIVRDYNPINITFQSSTRDFKGLGLSGRGKWDALMEDFPFMIINRGFSVGTMRGKDGKIPGPPPHLVEKVELFVNPGKTEYILHHSKVLFNRKKVTSSD